MVVNPWADPSDGGNGCLSILPSATAYQGSGHFRVPRCFGPPRRRSVQGIGNRPYANPVTLEAALIVLTDMVGLRHVVLEDAVDVTSPANAVEVAADLAQRLTAALLKKWKQGK